VASELKETGQRLFIAHTHTHARTRLCGVGIGWALGLLKGLNLRWTRDRLSKISANN